MGSSRALICSTAFVLVLLSSASQDEHNDEQRELTFDHDKSLQEMQQPDSFMLQRPLDLSEMLSPEEIGQLMLQRPVLPEEMQPDSFMLQRRVDPEEMQPDSFMLQRPVDPEGIPRQGFSPPARRRPSFRPRSFGGPPALKYPVLFPPARPSSDNLPAICLHGDQRPLYPDTYFPLSGFGQLKRRATAVNNAESWFRSCCQRNETWGKEVTLCCTTQAWELSVNSFCEEDVSVKDIIYDCCKYWGSDRLNCFHNDAPNPSYGPTEELPVPPLPDTNANSFSFDPNTCQGQRTVMTPYAVRESRRKKMKKPFTSQKVDINFPPGRPTAETIESLCNNQKLRPLYTVKCLPGSGFEQLSRQAKSVNRIEKGFKQCCKKKQGALKCADQKWREELDKFCGGERGGDVDFHCCSAAEGENDRYDCFQSTSPDPHYNMTTPTEELSLSKICDTHKIIKKKFPVGFPLKSFVSQCCPLPEQDKASCFVQTLRGKSEKLCSSKKASPPAVRRCCRASSEESPQCISKILMDAVTKATNLLRQKKKKRCPLS